MANRIQFNVSCTPIAAVAAGENIATETIAIDMQKSLGGSGEVKSGETVPSITVDFTTTAGYTANTVAYGNIATSATTTTLIADASAYEFICIRHTGYEYLAATTLSSATTMAIDIYINTQPICCIRPGEAIILPLRSKTGAVLIGGRLQSGTTGVAVEYFATT